MAVGVSALCSLFDSGRSPAGWFLPDCDSAGLKQALPGAALPGAPCWGGPGQGPSLPLPASSPESPALSPRTDTWAHDTQPGREHTASGQDPRSAASFGDSCGLWLTCGPLFFAHTVFQTEILRSDSLLKCIDQWFGYLTTLSETRTFVSPVGGDPELTGSLSLSQLQPWDRCPPPTPAG